MNESIPAYLIASSQQPEGHGSLEPYFKEAFPLFMKAGAELLVAGDKAGKAVLLEAEWPDDAALTIFRFPSMEALTTLWNSPEYKAIKHLRTDVIGSNFTIAIEGFAGFPGHA